MTTLSNRTNSDLSTGLRLLNSWNIQKTASGIEGIRAEVGRALQDQSIALEISNRLATDNLAIACASYVELSAINQTLDRIALNTQRSIEQGFASVEQGFGEVVGAVREQTALHREYYQRQQRADDLRELIYGIRKFCSSIEVNGCPYFRLYAARNYRRLLEARSFGTKDLPDIQDKESFDAVLFRITAIETETAREVLREIDEFEKNQATLQLLLATNVEAELPQETLEFSPDPAQLERDIRAKYGPRPPDAPRLESHSKVGEEIKRDLAVIIFGSFISFTCLDLFSLSDYQVSVSWAVIKHILIWALVVSTVRTVKRVRSRNAPAAKDWREYDQKLQEFEAKFPTLIDKAMAVYEEKNVRIREANQKRARVLNSLLRKRESTICELKSVIADFLGRYPRIRGL